MSASIVNILQPGQRIQLGHGDLVRKLDLNPNWSRIVIGVCLVIDSPGGNLTSTPKLAIGLCSGNVAPFGAGNTTHFVGASSTLTTWADETNYYSTPSSTSGINFGSSKKINATETTSASSFFVNISYQPNIFTAIVFKIDRGSPNFTIRGRSLNDAYAANNLPLYEGNFFAMIESDASLLSNWYNSQDQSTNGLYQLGNPRTAAVDEATDGYLDHLNISWNRSATPLQFKHIGVAIW